MLKYDECYDDKSVLFVVVVKLKSLVAIVIAILTVVTNGSNSNENVKNTWIKTSFHPCVFAFFLPASVCPSFVSSFFPASLLQAISKHKERKANS